MMSAETMKRDRVFLRFEDSDYYYRTTAVERSRQKIKAAEQAQDELAEIKAYEELGTLLSAGRDVTWRRKFFNDCLRPMSDVFVSEKAGGYLYDLLGRQALDVGLDDYAAGYFEKAVDFGSDSVLGREDVVRKHPGIIIRWIKGYLQKSARDAKVEEREALLDRIVASRNDASVYYLDLADVLKDKYSSAADLYYRKCIRLGCDLVANCGDFLKEGYELDYVDWFKSLIASGEKPADAAGRCFSRLWQTCSGTATCSESHHEYADSLWRTGAKRDAAMEYIRCAEARFDWAEQWLHANVADRMVRDEVSASSLVDSWFRDCEKSLDRQRTLGCCFDAGGGTKYSNDLKYYACIARSRLAAGNILGAVRACLDMDAAKHGGERDFMAQTALEGFQELRRDIREVLRKNVRFLVEKEMASKEYDSQIIDFGELALRPDALPTEDLRILKEYVNSGALEVCPFRKDGEKPLCSRYMILAQLEKMFVNGALPMVEARTLNFLRTYFGNLADQEFSDSVKQENPMTTSKWIIHHLYVSKDSSERKVGEAALYRMVSKWQRGDDELPIKLLASYWKFIGRAPEYMLALRVFLDNDRELHKWVDASDPKMLFGLVYQSITDVVRS